MRLNFPNFISKIMSKPKSLLGRIAQLCDLVSQPNLNELFVVIKEYDPHSQRFAVTTLECPTKPRIVANYKVKVQNLKFNESPSFSDRFVDIPELWGPLTIDGPYFGPFFGSSSWNITDCTFFAEDYSLLISSSSCFRNAMQTPKVLCGCPNFRWSSHVVIQCELDDSVVEFEDINFDENYAVECHRGIIIFRRCRFSSGCYTGGKMWSVNVLFESCLFERQGFDCDLNVGRNASVVFLNCVFLQGTSINVSDALSTILKHCAFSGEGETAIKVVPQCNAIELHNCSVGVGRAMAAAVSKCKTIVVQGCCLSAALLLVCARNAVIDDCTFSDSNLGIAVSSGQIAATVSNCRFQLLPSERSVDISISTEVSGNFNVSNCVFSHNRSFSSKGAVRVGRGSECVVTYGGVRCEAWYVRPSQRDSAARKIRTPVPVQPGAGKAQWGKLDSLRGNQRLEDGVVLLCFACDKEEPEGVSFKRCAKCNQACYCSKECQVAPIYL